VLGVLRQLPPARLGGYGSPGSGHGAGAGRDIAEWADSPEKLALVWIVGGAVLIAILVLAIKMKMDKD